MLGRRAVPRSVFGEGDLALLPDGRQRDDSLSHLGIDILRPLERQFLGLTLAGESGLQVRQHALSRSSAVTGRERRVFSRRFPVQLEQPHRLLHPLIRKDGVAKRADDVVDPANPWTHFRRATWEEALERAASGLKAIRDRDGSKALAGFGSAKASNEEAYLFQKLVRASPSDSRNFLGLGYSYAGLQQYDSAISAFSQAVTLDPKSPAPQFALGQAQLKAGRFTDAQATYRRLLKEYPNDSRARAALHFASRQPH